MIQDIVDSFAVRELLNNGLTRPLSFQNSRVRAPAWKKPRSLRKPDAPDDELEQGALDHDKLNG